MQYYPVPPVSAEAWRKYKPQRVSQNASLIFERFLPDLSRHTETTAKQDALKEVQYAASRADKDLLAAWRERYLVGVSKNGAIPFTMKTDWRFMTGLGRKGPLEVGFTFHRYGFPILPGSSVKGIARAYAQQMAGLDEQDADFVTIFGRADEENEAKSQAGRAIFYDAIPAAFPTLELDVMTPHFPKYYQEDKPPTDSQNPIPIYFLTVGPNTPFLFAVGWRGTLEREGNDEMLRLHKLAQTWLEYGLEMLGAGAKTRAGYGFFRDRVAVEVPVEVKPAPKVDPEEVLVGQLIESIGAITSQNVANQIKNYHNQWEKFEGDENLRLRLAIAICKRVESSSFRKSANKRKKWYQKLKASLPKGALK